MYKDSRAPRRVTASGDSSVPMGQQGRMVPIAHQGSLPWVQLRNATFHPIIFQKMIGRQDPRARSGDLVSVYDRDGHFFGTGLLNTHSQVGLRMLSFDATPVDDTLIAQRLRTAIDFRRNVLKLDTLTDAYRLVHAEGDGLPGLIIDRLGEHVVIEFFALGMFQRRESLGQVLMEIPGVKEVHWRSDQRIQDAEGCVLPARGAQRERSGDRQGVILRENGLRFQVDLTHGHKTGFFCDQRDNRLELSRLTAGAQMLDICSYSGGFGVYAAAKGQAAQVTCVDLDEDAIALARRNANLNQIPNSRFETVHADGFPYLRQMKENGRSFDVVVLDPPKLIPSRADYEEGRSKYFDLNKLGLGVVKPGGFMVTCSCSGLVSPEEFLHLLRGAARSAQRRVQIFRSTGAGADHPVMTECPESAYLKCLWCRVL